jgi:hypothetical protein
VSFSAGCLAFERCGCLAALGWPFYGTAVTFACLSGHFAGGPPRVQWRPAFQSGSPSGNGKCQRSRQNRSHLLSGTTNMERLLIARNA